jgi:hypothetical protein
MLTAELNNKLKIYAICLQRQWKDIKNHRMASVASEIRNKRLPNMSLEAASIPGQVTWDLWWTKWHWGRSSPSTYVSPANSNSTNFSLFINHHVIDAISSKYRQRS